MTIYRTIVKHENLWTNLRSDVCIFLFLKCFEICIRIFIWYDRTARTTVTIIHCIEKNQSICKPLSPLFILCDTQGNFCCTQISGNQSFDGKPTFTVCLLIFKVRIKLLYKLSQDYSRRRQNFLKNEGLQWNSHRSNRWSSSNTKYSLSSETAFHWNGILKYKQQFIPPFEQSSTDTSKTEWYKLRSYWVLHTLKIMQHLTRTHYKTCKHTWASMKPLKPTRIA